VRIDVFLVSADSGNSHLEQVPQQWLQDLSLRAVLSHFPYRQPTRSVVVPYNGDEGRLLKHPAIRAHRIIHAGTRVPCRRIRIATVTFDSGRGPYRDTTSGATLFEVAANAIGRW
jgi:hypothetical protein